MVNTKAERLKQMTSLPQNDHPYGDRLPPGQVLTERFPILHEGSVPEYNMTAWSFRVFGEVEEEKLFTFDELMQLPKSKLVCDIHCVTRWSKFDTEWEGVRFKDLLAKLRIKPGAAHVMVHADHDYQTNVPLEDLLRDDIMLATHYNGKPLTPKHGWPLRLIVPHLYFWKSAKWIRGLEFMAGDKPGFWESNGFHMYGDASKEQRFSGEPLDIPEDEWVKKEFD
ncbi:sulfite oxidase-like oxidoreductase [Paenibacillus sp. P26]|nr:sulfite oxidase-like oxidoreductase [Paenibacillus sp. P26]UUZ95797.1 sulfite oxidase-like oxidoreductase [Paenibacillus sp. P25]